MAKFQDIRSLGKSNIAPYIKDETWRARHDRRKNINMSFSKNLSDWCNQNNWKFEIKNNGHHWIFKKNNILVEWWPSSAKLVKNKKWGEGLHCHDYLKIIEYLKRVTQ